MWFNGGYHGDYPLVMTNRKLWFKSSLYSWENSLFLWSFSTAMLDYQRETVYNSMNCVFFGRCYISDLIYHLVNWQFAIENGPLK